MKPVALLSAFAAALLLTLPGTSAAGGKGTVVTLGPLKSTTPADWKSQQPANKFRAYQFGVGVPESRKLAISWHYEAAVRGNGVSASEYVRLSKSGSNFIGFHDANERALFRALPTVLISAEPAGTVFHNSAERMADRKSVV